MGEKYEPKVGDYVRVVLEGEAESTSEDFFTLGSAGWSNCIDPDAAHVVSVEKVAPPVVTFKPGDVVRSRVGGYAYTLTEGGYVAHHSGRFHRDDEPFTSQDYGLVELP